MDEKKKKNKSIKLILYAGLCNQLFMIFATISYALDHNFDYYIYSGPNRTLENNNKVYWDTFLDTLRDKLLDKIDFSIPVYQEQGFHYNQIPFVNQDFNIKGYFQTYKYFQHNYDAILKILKINEKKEQIKNKYEHLFKKKTIAMHFRMGDYIPLPNYHPIATPLYYNNALLYLDEKLTNMKEDTDILFFCQKQDNEIVNRYIEIINKDKNYNFVKISDEIPDWEQLLLMSCCDHFIIANSTFSWFGAYFSSNNEKIITYPSVWFGNDLKHYNLSDLCPKEWIKLDV